MIHKSIALGIIACATMATAQTAKPSMITKPLSPKLENISNSINAALKAKLVESVEKKGNELVIPYKKYKLGNGLTIVVHEDHSDPIVHVDVTYHVGSAREQEGRSGFAHFFEHMMFQGSKHVADEQHFKIITEAGGTLNGTTNTDRTNYFETVPSNQLEKMLWLESDRMGYLLDSVTKQKFEVQRATVKNERGQRYDNAPYGVVGEKIGEAMFPTNHPYAWTTIGYIEDLNRVDENDLKKFFLRWYGPNNATITVAGDVNTDATVALIEKYFAMIPRGPEVVNMPKMPAVLNETKYLSYEDNVRFPMIRMAFPTVESYNNDEAALDVLSDILGGGNTSRLYQAIVKTQKGIRTASYQSSRELAGQFEIVALGMPGKPLADMQKEINDILDLIDMKGIQEEDLVKFKAKFKVDLYSQLESVSGKASNLAAFQTYLGNPNEIGKTLERYERVTVADVMRVFRKYIYKKNAVILSCVPKGKADLIAAKDNFTKPTRNVDLPESAEYKNLNYNPINDFDRSKMPKAGVAPLVGVPALWKDKFENGIKVLGNYSNDVPKINISISVRGAGHRSESQDKSGTANLLAALMNEGTTTHTSEQISDMLDKLGSSYNVSASNNELTIDVTSTKENIDKTLAIVNEAMMTPLLSQEDFDRIKKQTMEGIANNATQPVAIANNAFGKLLYGNDNILSVSASGTVNTVEKITLEDVKAFYASKFSPSIASVIITGDAKQAEIMPKLGFLKAWKGNMVKEPIATATPKQEKTKIYFIHKDKAAQSEIRLGAIALPYDATGEYYKSQIMNYSFGGAFNSRVNLLLREKRGFTYGARAGFSGSTYAGPYSISAGVKANTTDSSIVDCITLMKEYNATGITKDELDFTRNALGMSDALKYETPDQKAVFIKRLIDYNLADNFVKQQGAILKTITKAEVDALAKKYIDINKFIILVVGDREVVYKGLEKIGYEIIELDTEGNPVKK